MGDVLPFPIARRRPHVALSWDDAWASYRVEVHGHPDAPHMLSFYSDYGPALDYLLSVGERLTLPMIDLTSGAAA